MMLKRDLLTSIKAEKFEEKQALKYKISLDRIILNLDHRLNLGTR